MEELDDTNKKIEKLLSGNKTEDELSADITIDENLVEKLKEKKKESLEDIERQERTKKRIIQLRDEITEKLDKVNNVKSMKNIWILKPGENTNRGVGITVHTKLAEIKEIINAESNSDTRTFILQRYIEKPALYKNRKFDIRCFAMVTSVNGHLKGYNYTDGYLRTSGKEYNLKNFNKFVHLTNDAV